MGGAGPVGPRSGDGGDPVRSGFRLRRRLRQSRRLGRPFPVRRPVAFAAGWVVLVLALVSPVDSYADVSFTMHMLQHLLTLVVPPLLALGAPITLAFATLPTGGAQALAGVLRSRGVRALANPVVGWSLFVGVPIAVHASRLFDLALTSTRWHAVEHGVVGAALVYWWPIVGVDPSPHPIGYGARLLSLLLAMPAMSFLALAIYGRCPAVRDLRIPSVAVGSAGARRPEERGGAHVGRGEPRPRRGHAARGDVVETPRRRGAAPDRGS